MIRLVFVLLLFGAIPAVAQVALGVFLGGRGPKPPVKTIYLSDDAGVKILIDDTTTFFLTPL